MKIEGKTLTLFQPVNPKEITTNPDWGISIKLTNRNLRTNAITTKKENRVFTQRKYI